MPPLRAPPFRPADNVSDMDPLLAATIAKLPPTGKPWASTDREAWFTLMRNVCDVVYGPVEPLGVTISRGTFTNGTPGTIPAAASAPKLYVIKEDGQARCDGQPMAFKDIPPAGCTFIDKRGPNDDAVFAWESIMFSDGAVPPGTKQPPGVVLMPKVAGPKVRSVAGEEGEGAFT